MTRGRHGDSPDDLHLLAEGPRAGDAVEATGEALDEVANRPRALTGVLNAILRTCAYLLLAVAIAFACITIIVPKVAGAIPVTILSNSMAPTMPVGSLAIIKPNTPLSQDALLTKDADEIRAVSDYSTLQLGDIVAYQPDPGDPTLIVHRIIRMSSHADGRMEYTTKGDNNRVADRDTVFDHQIRGTVWYHLPPPIGSLNTWLNHNPTNHLIAVILVASIGYLWALMQFILPWRAQRKAARADARQAEAESAALGRHSRPQNRQ